MLIFDAMIIFCYENNMLTETTLQSAYEQTLLHHGLDATLSACYLVTQDYQS